MNPKRFVRLYPRAWRERYGDELAALVESAPTTWRLRIDLVRGAAREWLHEIAHPRRLTPGRRLAVRHTALVLITAGLAIGVVGIAAVAAPSVDFESMGWPGYLPIFGLYIAMICRALYVGAKNGTFVGLPATKRGPIVSYPEFGAWIGIAVFTSVLITPDAATSPLSRWSHAYTLWLVFSNLYGATPAAARHARIARRLMARPGYAAAENARFERKRAEHAERLMRFYGRVPPLPSPFLSGISGPDRT